MKATGREQVVWNDFLGTVVPEREVGNEADERLEAGKEGEEDDDDEDENGKAGELKTCATGRKSFASADKRFFAGRVCGRRECRAV